MTDAQRPDERPTAPRTREDGRDAIDPGEHRSESDAASDREKHRGEGGAETDREEPILRAEDVATYFEDGGFLDSLLGRPEPVRAVDGVTLELRAGETLAVVGESGCGKTTLARTLVGLLEPTAGTVTYRGRDLAALSGAALREVRSDVQYVFQNARASLDPRQTVGEALLEPMEIHDVGDAGSRPERVARRLADVGLDERHAERYPHELSGGQAARVALARALAVEPTVLVCDEPTSGLDVSVQAQVCNLLADVQETDGLSVVLVAHDLSVVRHLADRVAVLYLGELVEVGPTDAVFAAPSHPYTAALRSAIPEPDPRWEGDPIVRSGEVPSPTDPPCGCRFHTRCPHVIQPPGVDVERTVWRSVVDLLVRLDAADDLAEVVGVASSAAGADLDPTTVSRARLEALVRQAFDLPDRVEHGAEPALQRALDRLHDRDLEGARAALADAVETPCRGESPGDHETGVDHRIACHLYDDRFEHARRQSAPDDVRR